MSITAFAIIIGVCLNSVQSFDTFEVIRNGLQNYEQNKPKNLSEECSKQLDLFTDGVQNFEMWAIQMLDAASKLQSGITSGNTYDLGAFDQCVGIEKQLNEETLIRGKYCLGNLNINNIDYPGSFQRDISRIVNNKNNLDAIIGRAPGVPGGPGPGFGLSWAACLPAVCSASEFNEFFDKLTNRTFRFKESGCQSKDTEPALKEDSSAVAAITIFGIILGLIALSTVYDAILYYTQTKAIHEICVAFSALTNFRKVVTISNNPNQLLCLNGLKGISMMWILMGHGYMNAVGVPMSNSADTLEWFTKEINMFIIGSTVSVDTFFLIGGLLVSYTFFASASKGIKFNILLYYLHRYIRLTPPLAALIWVYASLLPYLSSGPVYPSTYDFNERFCQENWWSALLYIQNYHNSQQMCIMQSWYLSVDMQLFVISPILLLPLKKKPLWGILWIMLVCCASLSSTFAVAWIYKLTGLPNSNADMTHMDKFNKYIYFATHSRMPPYLFGIILGYYIQKLKEKKVHVKINTYLNLFLWGCSMGILATCVFAGHNVLVGEYDRIEQTFYITFVRPAWAIGLCWVIFACVFGYGGPIDWILSCGAFQVVSKLSYSIYLVHMLVLIIVYGSVRSPFRFSNLKMFYNFWGDFWFSMALSLIWTLMFESPMITIEKIIFGRGKRAEQPNKTTKEAIP